MKKIYSLLMIVFFSLISFTSCKGEEDLGFKVEERTLNFYALNDFHGAYLYDEDYEEIGISKLGEFLIKEKEVDPENTFVICSGDMFQGGAESNLTYGQILIDAMNIIGFDSMTIGNHEFDWGEDVLKEMEASMNFPLLGINVFYNENNNRPEYLESSVIIKKEGIKVGIIGAIMPGIEEDILATIAKDFSFPSNIDLIKEEASRLKNNENCDIVILSTHDGEYKRYIDLVGYIDALFLGHDHDVKEGYLDEENKLIPYIEGGTKGNYLSNIELELKLENNHYKVVGARSENIETFNDSRFSNFNSVIDASYQEYASTIEPQRDKILYSFDTSVGKGNFAKFVAYSLFSYVTNYDPKVDVTAGVINGGGIRDDISKGEFTYGDLIRIYPFENRLCILEFDPNMYPLFINGQEYVYKSNPPIVVDGYYYVATIDYVAYKNTTISLATKIVDYDITCRDLVAEFLQNEGYIAFN